MTRVKAAVSIFADVGAADVFHALSTTGVWIDAGATVMQVRSDSKSFASQLCAVYGQFPFVVNPQWADLHVQIRRPRTLRRWLRPQVVFGCDAAQPFEPYPATSPLPLFEWGCNWLISRRLNNYLLLHAGVVEKQGLALVLPAMPGSGKSTFTAALAQGSWRLLSDEFGAVEPQTCDLFPVLKPIALKNESIDVIRRFAPHTVLGPEFAGTRKGTVAHVAARGEAVERRHQGARLGAVVLPKWVAGSPTRFEPLAQHTAFSALAFNAFNYNLLGSVGFHTVVRLVRQCLAWQLVYSDLDDAVATIEAAWPQVVERHRVALP